MIIWGLVLLFAVMMSIPYLVPHTGFLALFGIIPLLCVERIATLSDKKHIWIYHYSAFVLWNAITTFWVCNATVGGGLFAIFANAFQMSLVFGLFRLSKKKFCGALPYIFLMVTWIAWERFYFDAEISWPWLVLGNAFARSIGSIQWYEFTGSLGGSLWVWMSNLSIFGLLVSLSDGSIFTWNWKAKTAAFSGLAALLIAPFIVSAAVGSKFFIDVDQRGRCRHAFGNREGKAHRLSFFMIGILAEDHDFGRRIGCAAQCVIKISCRRKDRSGAVFLIKKGSELLIIRGSEFRLQDVVPVISDDTHIPQL